MHRPSSCVAAVVWSEPTVKERESE